MDTEEAEVGTAEPERPLVSVLVSGSLGGFSNCSLLHRTVLRSTRL